MEKNTWQLLEIGLGERAGRFACAPSLVPAPGQYLLLWPNTEPPAPQPQPVFSSGYAAGGFYAASPLPVAWRPGQTFDGRGPLGQGFHLPAQARRVTLAALGSTCARLLPLLEAAQRQGAEISLLTRVPPQIALPPEVEVSPLASLPESLLWADYTALDLPAAFLQDQSAPALLPVALLRQATEFLVETPLACGGLASCGVCALRLGETWKLACEDGPVFHVK